MLRQFIIIHLLAFACGTGVLAAAPDERTDRFWAAHVLPVLAENCFKCHGNIEAKSGLSLMTPAEVFRGGDSGPAVVPGQPGKSLLFQVLQADADPHMPPKGKQLAPEEILVIKRWIEKLGPADLAAATNQLLAATNAGASPLFRKLAWQPPPGLSSSQVIDRLIEQRWRELKVEPTAVCDDRTFCRRAYLDFAGRIPTPEELERFLGDKRRNRRAALIDELLAGEDFAVHMREVFDVVFMERGAFQTRRDRRRNPAKKDLTDRWHDYLEWSFRENRPWNLIAREIILARPANDQRRGAIQFLYARKDNAQQMAEGAGSALVGLQVKCAQCHDHPLAPEIKQGHYWGLVAAFNRSKAVDTGAGPGVAESATGGFIKFTNLKGASSEALVRFLDDKVVHEQRPAEGEKETDDAALYVNATPLGDAKNLKQVPVPKLSRREELADWLCDTNNPLLARAFVNRAWAMLLGRGLVHPVDRMDSSRAPSHPELLDWLADDFARGGFDVKRLLRTIANSRAYQLEARPAGKTRPPDDTFACALDKPLSAEVFARSLLIATGHPPGTNGTFAPFELGELQKSFADVYPDVFPTENVSTVRQALFLSNNRALESVFQSSSTNALASVAALEEREQVRHLFVRVLGREPARDEMKRALDFLRSRSHEPAAAARHLLWALVTGAEFRLRP